MGGGRRESSRLQGPFNVAVEEVPDPSIQHPNDVIVRVTSTAICGSDLHMYEGRTAAEPGIVFGHENMGIVEEVGAGRHLHPSRATASSCPSMSPAASARTAWRATRASA